MENCAKFLLWFVMVGIGGGVESFSWQIKLQLRWDCSVADSKLYEWDLLIFQNTNYQIKTFFGSWPCLGDSYLLYQEIESHIYATMICSFLEILSYVARQKLTIFLLIRNILFCSVSQHFHWTKVLIHSFQLTNFYELIAFLMN